MANGLNATEAAKSIGVKGKSAGEIGSRMLKKVKVQQWLSSLAKEKCDKLDITAERVLQELARIAFFDIRKIFNDDGSLKQVAALDANSAAAIAGIEHDKLFEHFGKGHAKHVGTTSKVKVADRIRALELLGKWHKLKLFVDRVENTADEALVQRLLAGRKRASAS